MKQLTIIYSSGGGNTRLVVDKISEILHTFAIQVELLNASVAKSQDLVKTPHMLLAAPTYDHGILHAPMDRLLLGAQDIDLSGISFAIVGLGDEKYDQEYTVEAAPILESFVTSHGGILLHESLKINKSPVGQLDTVELRTKDYGKQMTSV